MMKTKATPVKSVASAAISFQRQSVAIQRVAVTLDLKEAYDAQHTQQSHNADAGGRVNQYGKDGDQIDDAIEAGHIAAPVFRCRDSNQVFREKQQR